MQKTLSSPLPLTFHRLKKTAFGFIWRSRLGCAAILSENSSFWPYGTILNSTRYVELDKHWPFFMEVSHIYLAMYQKVYFYQYRHYRLHWCIFGNNEQSIRWDLEDRKIRIEKVDLNNLEVDKIDRVIWWPCYLMAFSGYVFLSVNRKQRV